MEAELEREQVATMREYLQDLKKVREMFQWVWKEFMTETGIRLAKKMTIVFFIGYVLNVLIPWCISLIFDGLANDSRKWDSVIVGITAVTAIYLVSKYVNYKGMVYRELLLGENLYMLDQKTTSLFFEKSLGVHKSENNILNEANIKKGYERVNQLKDMIVFEGIESMFGLLLPYIALWILDWKAGFLVTIMFSLYLVYSLYLNLRVMQSCIVIEKEWRAMNRFRVERLNQIERVKANNKEKDELQELGKRFEKIIEADQGFWIWFIKQISKRGFICLFVIIGILCYGIFEVWHGRLTIGLLYPLFTWTMQLTDNLWRVGHLEHQVNFVTPSILSMKEALTMPIGIGISANPVILPEDSLCSIKFEGVGHTYEGIKDGMGKDKKDLEVLKDVSLSIKPGEKIGITGPSGTGKTTFAQLLLRYMDPSEGRILVDGIDLKEIDLGSWLDLIGLVPQHAQILDGTIKYNLLYGLPESRKKEISDKEIERVSSVMVDFRERLTHGLDTVVGMNGIKLSGGQAQRIMIAAAILKHPKIIIFDEATSSLDATTIIKVQKGLAKLLSPDLTAIFIAHNLSTIRKICNKFIYIDGNGKGAGIAGVGSSFEELAQVCPDFKSLAEDQGIFF